MIPAEHDGELWLECAEFDPDARGLLAREELSA